MELNAVTGLRLPDAGQLAPADTVGSSDGQSDESLRQAANRFEAMFVENMLAAMRETLPEDSPFRGENEDIYYEMLDQKMAEQIVEQRGYGLADALVRQLGTKDATLPPSTHAAGRALDRYRQAAADAIENLPLP